MNEQQIKQPAAEWEADARAFEVWLEQLQLPGADPLMWWVTEKMKSAWDASAARVRRAAAANSRDASNAERARSCPAPGSAFPVGAAVDDTVRMDFLDQIGKPWPEEKNGKRLMLVAIPYKLLDEQSAPRTIREAIDYILDCPESVERALAEVEAEGSGKETLNAKLTHSRD